MPWNNAGMNAGTGNYPKWKRGVGACAELRQASGEESFYAGRNSKTPNDVMMWCKWDTAARMKKFMNSAEPRAAILAVIDAGHGATRQEIPTAVARMPGFKATGAQLRSVIEARRSKLLRQSVVEELNGVLKRMKTAAGDVNLS